MIDSFVQVKIKSFLRNCSFHLGTFLAEIPILLAIDECSSSHNFVKFLKVVVNADKPIGYGDNSVVNY